MKLTFTTVLSLISMVPLIAAAPTQHSEGSIRDYLNDDKAAMLNLLHWHRPLWRPIQFPNRLPRRNLHSEIEEDDKSAIFRVPFQRPLFLWDPRPSRPKRSLIENEEDDKAAIMPPFWNPRVPPYPFWRPRVPFPKRDIIEDKEAAIMAPFWNPRVPFWRHRMPFPKRDVIEDKEAAIMGPFWNRRIPHYPFYTNRMPFPKRDIIEDKEAALLDTIPNWRNLLPSPYSYTVNTWRPGMNPKRDVMEDKEAAIMGPFWNPRIPQYPFWRPGMPLPKKLH